LGHRERFAVAEEDANVVRQFVEQQIAHRAWESLISTSVAPALRAPSMAAQTSPVMYF